MENLVGCLVHALGSPSNLELQVRWGEPDHGLLGNCHSDLRFCGGKKRGKHNMKCFLDTETCGLHGMAVTLQYAFDDGPITVWDFWCNPIADSLRLIEKICECEVVGFNLTFDWFHLQKLYNVFALAQAKLDVDAWPMEHIEEIVALEERARDGHCIKPLKAFDLMLHARKTEFQITMNRGDIRIRRIPTGLAVGLAQELEKRIVLDGILFARRKNRLAPKWVIHNIEQADGKINPDFKDIVLKFKPSVALKALALHVLNIPPEEIISYGEIEVPHVYRPGELGYAPTAAAYNRWCKASKPAVRKKFRHKKSWDKVIEHHISHWRFHEQAREYAKKDVEFTRKLYEYFNSPETGDDDSELACMVGSVRWRGYAIDVPGIERLREVALKKIQETVTSPRLARVWIGQAMSETERKMFKSTGKVILERMAALAGGEKCPFGPCEHCNAAGMICDEPCIHGPCELCKHTGKRGPLYAQRAEAVLEARKMKKEVELYDKLLCAGRFHASFKIIGALSSRMSGTDGLNPQGIKRTKDVRSKFPFAFGGLKLWGGDFAGFEVTLADAAYNDAMLRKDLLTCENCRNVQVIPLTTPVVAEEWLSEQALENFIRLKTKVEEKKAKKDAKYVCRTPEQLKKSRLTTFACPKCGCNDRMKIHALFGVHVYPDMTYEQIKATDGTADDKYNRCKSAVFAMIYGGEGYTLMSRLGVDIETANEAYQKFCARYQGVGQARMRVINAFCSIRQQGGLGSKVVYNEPSEYVESLLGFRRYFVLENQIVKEVFDLAENPPSEWKKLKIKVRRRDRDQTIGGAVQSALFGTSFQIQAGNMRAAANHEIQSSGAGITKNVQRKIWDVQPHGVHEWLVQPMNVHDAIYTATHPSVEQKVQEVVFNAVESFRGRVPLIEFEYKPMQDWSSK